MTPDEQAFMDRVDGTLASLEVRVPLTQRLRQIPMDMIAIAVMREMATRGVPTLTETPAIEDALLTIARRNGSAPSQQIAPD